MPVIKCSNGKFRIGTGACIYDTQEKAQRVWDSISGNYAESYNDYPESASNNAKRALAWVAKNGWGSCGEATGKARANQLANKEKITRDTIARMASFKRHQQNKDVPYGEGCGGLMWDCWGGTSGIEWASNKLEQIDKFKSGVAHYLEDGTLWTGETHKAGDTLMTGAVHTKDSKPLYHKEDLAVVGKRGGIKASPKAPRSGSENKNPKGEGSAKGDASGKGGAKVTAEQEKTLQNKADDFNKKESNTKYGRAGLGALKSVFQRGLGAFNTSHSPIVKSASQWAFARVNAYLYLLKNGRPQNPKYTTDFDLLPKGHPKADK